MSTYQLKRIHTQAKGLLHEMNTMQGLDSVNIACLLPAGRCWIGLG